MSMDREKKIAEIREALETATPGPWEIVDIGGIEIARDYKYKNGKHSACWIAEMYQDEDMDEDQVYVDAHLIANAPEWLSFLLDELERLEREYAEERAAHNTHVTELCELEKENRKLREEREKWEKEARLQYRLFNEYHDESREKIEQLRAERAAHNAHLENVISELEERAKMLKDDWELDGYNELVFAITKLKQVIEDEI